MNVTQVPDDGGSNYGILARNFSVLNEGAQGEIVLNPSTGISRDLQRIEGEHIVRVKSRSRDGVWVLAALDGVRWSKSNQSIQFHVTYIEDWHHKSVFPTELKEWNPELTISVILDAGVDDPYDLVQQGLAKRLPGSQSIWQRLQNLLRVAFAKRQ